MGTNFDLSSIIKGGTPREEGRRLADVLLSRGNVDWENLTIEMRSMPLEILNISFFNGFLQRVFEHEPALLDRARATRWNTPTRLIDESVSMIVANFQPRRNCSIA